MNHRPGNGDAATRTEMMTVAAARAQLGEGAIIGQALYTGALDLKQALAAAR